MNPRLRLCALYLLGIFLGMSATPASAFGWQDLWHTPEQQAQRMLDAGHAKEAAQAFHDPRRRAYAQTQASQYAEAAKTLAPLQDADSLFNRGNALARAGQLQQALAAYDAALKKNPQDKDAQRNRALVEKALQQQKQQKQQSSQSGQNSKQGQQGQQDHSSQDGKQGQDQSQSNGQQQSGKSQSGQSQSDHSQQNKADTQKQTAPQNQSSPAQSGGQQAQDKQSAQDNSTQQQAQQQRSSTGQSTPTAKDDAAQARRDAAQALKAAQAQSQPATTADAMHAQAPAHGDQSAPAAQDSVMPRESEQALALDQWLRRIPDDPGGLLRRKFMIEHMLRQQENRQ